MKKFLIAFTSLIVIGSISLLFISVYNMFLFFQTIDNSPIPNNSEVIYNQIKNDLSLQNDIPPIEEFEKKLRKDLSKDIKNEDNKKNTVVLTDLLTLDLLGTIIAGADKSFNDVALIFDRITKKQAYYIIGDFVQGAEIKEILRRKVVLILNGKEHILTLKGKKMIEDEELANRPLPKNEEKNEKETPESKKPKIQLTDFSEIDNNIEVSIESAYLKDFMFNMEEEAEYTEQFEDKKLTGIKINNIQSSSFFDLIGVQEGDVIVGLNGKKTIAKSDLMRLQTYIRITPNFSVQVQRGDETKSFTYNIKK
ncbi:MAG: hypothetical protein HQK76_08305 [Desulfobacterales bacterium]|nr:hypothetical protein [Desulfobacterales bacterium]